MQFVTISDHNCIDGALEIAHLPGAFVSSEVTAYFPDGCKVHVLCWGITEAQFAEIQRLRSHILELRDYLHGAGIVHACAHPLYRVNDRLTIDHLEQLLLLFNVFETLNGSRSRRGNDLVSAILQQLSREQFEAIAARHAIEPVGAEPWVKGCTGGSDDHAAAFIAKGFTECPPSDSAREFLAHVAARQSRSGGLDGTPLAFAHGLYSIGYQYYRDRFLSSSDGGDLMLKTFGEIFGHERTRVGLRDRVSYYTRHFTRRTDVIAEIEFKRLISTEMRRLFGRDWLQDDVVASAERSDEVNRETFELASRIANQLLFQFSRKFVEKLTAGSVFGSLEAMSAAGPILLGVAPYLFAFAHQSRDKRFLSDVSRHFTGRAADEGRPSKKAWFTDAITDVNGVTTLIDAMRRRACSHGHDLTVISVSDAPPSDPGVQHFRPVGTFALPEHEGVTMAFPPFLDVLEYCERQQFNEIVVSTPGFVGLAAIAAARILDVPLTGIYHTDLPQYTRYYTEDERMESATWRYLRWFYEQMRTIYVPSEGYRQQLLARGFDEGKLRLLPHGADTDTFHPRHRDPAFWSRYREAPGPVVTYVGRVAKEKDLDVLAEVLNALAPARPDCTFAVVGDGPLLSWMRARLPHANVVFTGFLFGADLSAAYASSDVFVFPSTTDTFGNVVLEAMASAVPVVVSDRGGPCEIVQPGLTGIVTRARDATDLQQGIVRLLDSPTLRAQMSRACRAYAETCSWDRIYLEFWKGTPVASVPPVALPARQAS
jgi:glycosyltransferase involved in cell wall biosynthesis